MYVYIYIYMYICIHTYLQSGVGGTLGTWVLCRGSADLFKLCSSELAPDFPGPNGCEFDVAGLTSSSGSRTFWPDCIPLSPTQQWERTALRG